MKLLIKNGRLIDPKNKLDAVNDLCIADGKIVAIGSIPPGFGDCPVIDAKDWIVCPGLIDLSARLREPGLEYKATLESELDAAAAGGITSLACPPDTDPPLDEPGLVEMLKHRTKSLDHIHVYPIGALTQKLKGEKLTEMAELRDAGCVAFSHADEPLTNLHVLRQAMFYASTFNFSVWLRPQEINLANKGVAHDGEVATRLGLAPIPACAETIALSNIILLVREIGVRVHVCRISCAESVAMIRTAKQQKLPITCDVSINHLHLSEMDIGFFNTNCHLIPPLRNMQDRDSLRSGLLDGTIDAICSDHAPIDDDAKLLPFGESEAGASGLELLLSLTLKWASSMNLSLMDALKSITETPASILAIDAGHLSPGAAADICIFDPETYWKVTPTTLKSQGKNTPFMGMELPACVKYTLVGGNIIFQRSS